MLISDIRDHFDVIIKASQTLQQNFTQLIHNQHTLNS